MTGTKGDPVADFPSYPSRRGGHPENEPYSYPPTSRDGTYDPGYAYGYFQPNKKRGTGLINVMDAVGWGFKATFRGAGVWILGCFGLFFLAAAVGTVPNSGNSESSATYADLIFQVFLWATMVLGVNASLRHIDHDAINWNCVGEKMRFGPLFGTVVLIGLALSALQAIIVMVFGASAAIEMVNSGVLYGEDADPQQILKALGRLAGVLFIGGVLEWLLLPLYIFIPWAVGDSEDKWTSQIAAGYRAGLANYGKILLWSLLFSICAALVTLVTVGLALLIIAPATVLMVAHMYRQATGGVLPVDNPLPRYLED